MAPYRLKIIFIDGLILFFKVDYDEESDDEKLLTEYARHTLEVFVLDHIFCNKIEIAYKEASELKMHEELIREEDLKKRRVNSTKSS